MPTYRSCGDRFLGRWKQGEGEIEGESRYTEEYERTRGERGNGVILSFFLFHTALRLCFIHVDDLLVIRI